MHLLGRYSGFMALGFFSLGFVTPLHADTLQTQEFAVAATADMETTPTIGRDEFGYVVVYTRFPVDANGNVGAGNVWYQRLNDDGSPQGAPMRVSRGGTDDTLNDISGDYIVYTAYDSSLSDNGRIAVYQISTDTVQFIGNSTVIRAAKIYGTKVSWVQGNIGATVVMMYDVRWLGHSHMPTLISDPTHPVRSVEVGDRFIVWDKTLGNQSDLDAYELATGIRSTIVADLNADDGFPSTSGPWVVWRARNVNTLRDSVELINLDIGERRTLADNTIVSSRPSIDEDLVAYETNQSGNFDVYVYRLSENEQFQVTNNPSDQQLNHIYGELVSYRDNRSGSLDVYVSHLTFASADPCAQAGGDGDHDGVCQNIDNCPAVANADQADSDSDGNGDLCDICPLDAANDSDADGVCGAADNCPAVANADQADSDNDGNGDVCDSCPLDAANDLDTDGVCGNADNCPAVANTSQGNADNDGLGDVCDLCPLDATNDADGDGICQNFDNCQNAANADQSDADSDGAGDACDSCKNDPFNDADGDGVCGNVDNCPLVANANQSDFDQDGIGSACDRCAYDPTNDANHDGRCDNPMCGCGDDDYPDLCGSCMNINLVASKTYRPTRWQDGSHCLCRPVEFKIPATLAVTVGNAGNQKAYLTYTDAKTHKEIKCSYKGGASKSHPTSASDIQKGLVYKFVDCCNGLKAGKIARAEQVELHIDNGDSYFSETKIELSLAEVSNSCTH